MTQTNPANVPDDLKTVPDIGPVDEPDAQTVEPTLEVKDGVGVQDPEATVLDTDAPDVITPGSTDQNEVNA